MDIYVLNYTLSTNISYPDVLIDDYISFTWVERFNGKGDLTLKVPWSLQWREKLGIGSYLWLDRSTRIMKVYSYSVSDQDDLVIEVKARSIESMLSKRFFRGSPDGLEEEDKRWVISNPYGTVKTLCTRLFTLFVATSFLGQRAVNNIKTTTFYTKSNVVDGPYVSDKYLEGGTLQSAYDKLYDSYRCGISLCRNPNTEELHFIPLGYRDLTNFDTVYNGMVVFNRDQRSLLNSRKVIDSSENLNGIIAISERTRYTDHPRPTNAIGIEAEYGLVEVREVDGVRYSSIELRDIARESIGTNLTEIVMDAKIAEDNPYQYDIDYRLGDTVLVEDPEGGYLDCLLIEYTFIGDRTNGNSEYPTFEYLRDSTI